MVIWIYNVIIDLWLCLLIPVSAKFSTLVSVLMSHFQILINCFCRLSLSLKMHIFPNTHVGSDKNAHNLLWICGNSVRICAHFCLKSRLPFLKDMEGKWWSAGGNFFETQITQDFWTVWLTFDVVPEDWSVVILPPGDFQGCCWVGLTARVPGNHLNFAGVHIAALRNVKVPHAVKKKLVLAALWTFFRKITIWPGCKQSNNMKWRAF